MRRGVIIWSTVSGILIGLLIDAVLVGLAILGGVVFPAVQLRLATNLGVTIAVGLLLVIPVVTGVLGFLEGRLKAT
jgi:hypothetical protein